MIILNNFYQDSTLKDLINQLDFQDHPNGQILPDFEFNPPELIPLINTITNKQVEITTSLFFKPNKSLLSNQYSTLYVCLSDTILTTYRNNEVYSVLHLKENQFIILEPMIVHHFDSELIQLIEFKEE
jgi:hypothetical protein